MKERNIEIDIMKGIAILCVMLGHTTWIPGWLGTFIYSFHMPLFFFVSGYFAKTYSEYQGSGWEYVIKNLRQLVVPYMIIAGLSCIYPLIQAIYYSDYSLVTHKAIALVLALDRTWTDTLFDADVAPIWFLLALFWGRLIFYFISRWEKWIIPVCMILSIAMILLHPYVVTPLCVGRGLEGLFFIAIGWAYRKYSFPIWLKIISIIAWVCSMCLGSMDMYFYRYSFMPIDIIGACGGTLVIYYVSKGIAKTFFKPFFAWCGRNSLIILGAHTIESSMTVIHMLTKILPIQLPLSIYYGIRHVMALCGAWVYERTKSYYKHS